MTGTPPTVVASGSGSRLPLVTQIGWGLGTLGPALVMAAFNVLMLRFMTDTIGIAAATAGLLIAASKLYDAVTDPLTGVLSDRSRARRSRRRPWLLLGGLGLSVSFVLMFVVPDFASPGWATLYMGAMLILYASAYSAYSIPYMAMPAEMTQDYHERSRLMTWRVAAVALAGIVAQAIGLKIIESYGGGASGHAAMALMLCPLVFLSALVAWAATRHAPYTVRDHREPRYRLADQLRLIGSNRPFVILLGVKLFTLMMLGIQAAFPFFFNRILGVSDGVLGLYFAAAQLSLLASQPVWVLLCRRLGKRGALMLALAGLSAVSLSWLVAGAGDPAWHMYARGVVLGFAQGGILLMGQALLPDTIEYDYLKCGLRREGLFASIYTTVEKLAQAIGVAGVGAFLGAAGYIAGSAAQPESALDAIRLSVGLVPALLCGTAFVLLIFYNLSESRLVALREEARR